MEILSLGASPTPQLKVRRMDEASEKLEATFIFEMLKALEPEKAEADFGGGIGEDQFSSFLLQLRSEAIVKSGGLGLAEHFRNALGAERE